MTATVDRTTRLAHASALVGEIFTLYPERDVPHPFVPTRTAVMEQLQAGVDADTLLDAARNYRTHCAKEGTAPKYVIGPVRFYRDEIWRLHVDVRVHGRTRVEWARSGQDVAEFDRLAGGA